MGASTAEVEVEESRVVVVKEGGWVRGRANLGCTRVLLVRILGMRFDVEVGLWRWVRMRVDGIVQVEVCS